MTPATYAHAPVQAVDYKGPRSARALVNALTAALPSHVIEVTDKNLAGFRANGSLPKASLRVATPVPLVAWQN